MMFVYIYDPPLFRQCDVTDNAYVEEDFTLDGSADTSGGLRKLNLNLPLISIIDLNSYEGNHST